MDAYTKGSGIKRLGNVMELAFSSGLMAPNMKGSGRKTEPLAKEE